jgi:uncharacterized protein YcbX
MAYANTALVSSLFRYPVKGLSAERLERVSVQPNQAFPWDRAFAIENGSGAFDEANPRHLPKIAFIMLMRHEQLALLDTRFDEHTQMLEIWHAGAMAVNARIDHFAGRKTIEAFFDDYMGDVLRGRARIVASPGHNFSDVDAKCVSIINLETVREIARVAGVPVDPMRFRGNIYIEGLDPFKELDLAQDTFHIGDVAFEGIKRTVRCNATTVNLQTGIRDLNIPKILSQSFGHSDCGIYAKVKTSGKLHTGMTLEDRLGVIGIRL